MKKYFFISIFLLLIIYIIGNYFLFPIRYKNIIIEHANKYNLKPCLVASVICAESGFNKQAISNKGAVGLMQIIPSTGEWLYSEIYTDEFTTDKLLNPNINIELGSYYLNYLLQKFNNVENALCAYNAGETVVRKWLQDKNISEDGKNLKFIPYPETSRYVKKIKNYLKVYYVKFN